MAGDIDRVEINEATHSGFLVQGSQLQSDCSDVGALEGKRATSPTVPGPESILDLRAFTSPLASANANASAAMTCDRDTIMGDHAHDGDVNGSQGGGTTAVAGQPEPMQQMTEEADRRGNPAFTSEIEILLFDNIQLLSDAIHLAIPLLRAGHHRIILTLIDRFQYQLLRNDKFCKDVFDSREYREESRTPKYLRPETGDDNPNGLTYFEITKQVRSEGNQDVIKSWQEKYEEVAATYRRSVMLNSEAFCKGEDKPGFKVKQELGIVWTDEKSYVVLIEEAKQAEKTEKVQERKFARSAYVESLKKARDGQERQQMTYRDKTMRFFSIFAKLMIDNEFLPHTCRGCSNGEARQRPGSTLPHCGMCYPDHAQQNMISARELE